MSGGFLTVNKPRVFETEKELQNIIEKNLHVLGLYLIKSEMKLKSKRFDTVCVSEDSELYIIEYKKQRTDFQQSQINNYANELLNNTSDFISIVESLFSTKKISEFVFEASIKAAAKFKVNKICIASDYDKYTLQNQSNDSNLYKYYLHDFCIRLESIPDLKSIILSLPQKQLNIIKPEDYLITLTKSDYFLYNVSGYIDRIISVNGTKLTCTNFLLGIANFLDTTDLSLLSYDRFINPNKKKLRNPVTAANGFFIEDKIDIIDRISIIFMIAQDTNRDIEIVLVKK